MAVFRRVRQLLLIGSGLVGAAAVHAQEPITTGPTETLPIVAPAVEASTNAIASGLSNTVRSADPAWKPKPPHQFVKWIDDQTDTADFGDGEYAGTFRTTFLPCTFTTTPVCCTSAGRIKSETQSSTRWPGEMSCGSVLGRSCGTGILRGRPGSWIRG